MKRIISLFLSFAAALITACGGGESSDSHVMPPTPTPTPLYQGMTQVNIEKTSIIVTLGFADQHVLGFLPPEKMIQFADIVVVCVSSVDDIQTPHGSGRCTAPDPRGIAKVLNTATEGCFQIYLRLKDGSESWSNLDNLQMTGVHASKGTRGTFQCLQYPTPESIFLAGMPQVNIEQTSMTVTLGFADQHALGFLPLEKMIQFADIALVCVNSVDHVWAGGSSHCTVPDAKGIAKVADIAIDDCFQIYLRLKDGSESWSNLDNLQMTGRSATKSTRGTSQCLQYGVAPAPVPIPLPTGMSKVNIEQTSMTVTLGFDGQHHANGFLPAEKQVQFSDITKVCVDSNTLGWGDASTRCAVPNAVAVAVLENMPQSDCFQLHLKLKDGTMVWGNLDSLEMTGREVTKPEPNGSQCLRYGTNPTPVPVPTPHVGMPQVNIEQNSMTVTLGFSGELILGFLPATKETRLTDVAKVCVDSDNLGWADYSTRCVAPDSSGVAMVVNTVTNDCFQLHLKLKDGSIVWGNIDNLVMTGRPATKIVLTSGTQCLHY